MKTKIIDNLNIGLIVLSLLLAFKLPFALFLFSYAVLGPIHYLTEINWLKQKNYFVKERKWVWLFVFLAALISIPVILNLPLFAKLNEQTFFKNATLLINGLTDVFLLTALFFAIGLIYLKKWQHILLFLIVSVVVAKLVTKYILFSYVLVGIFLPTIVHVYVFTLLFMLMGALNSKNTAGFVGVILLLLCPLVIYLFPINLANYVLLESKEVIATAGNFRFIQYITQTFNGLQNSNTFQLSVFGIKIQIFIAFCYTYHYLNWFSKTQVIGWHKSISKLKFALLLLIWLSLVFLFWYNYETAYLVLFFLALLHIILEFPLNVTCIKEIILKLYPNK